MKSFSKLKKQIEIWIRQFCNLKKDKIILSEKDYEKFVHELKNPSPPTEEAIKAVARYNKSVKSK